jgi:hypothetical protein
MRGSFFRAAFFAPARLGLALAIVRFVPLPRADLDAVRALPRAAELFLRTFARFFRLAMDDLLPTCCALRYFESVCAGIGAKQ